MKRKHLIQAAGETTGTTFYGETTGALSLFSIVCLILCFLVGLAAICLLLFSLF